MDSSNQYGTLAIQKELLKLLQQFDSFCQANNIQYTVSSGTLLGAIRHQGFIPWDDDLDIIVNRDNYMKLVKHLPSTHLLIEKDEDVVLWIDRIRLKDSVVVDGHLPTLDVFIIDNCPEGKISSRIKVFLLKFLQGMMKSHPQYKNYPVLYKILSLSTYLLGRIVPDRLLTALYHRISSWGNSHATPFKSLCNDSFTGLSIKYPADIFTGTTRKKFENIEVSVMNGYDKYLTLIYGDYMSPPQEHNRIPTHGMQ